MSTLEAIKFNNGSLEILDQLKLPFQTDYLKVETIQDGWLAINEMKVYK
jgi:methylthioribose-1-phosphate isomerase